MQDNIEKFEAVSDQILDVIDQFPREQRETLIFDKWSLKDIVSHLNHWMEHLGDMKEKLALAVKSDTD